LCILIPFWISVLTRAFGWLALLSNKGILNTWLMATGITTEPLTLVRNELGVVLGMVHFLIPFAVFPLASAMRSLDERVLMAARGMGASRDADLLAGVRADDGCRDTWRGASGLRLCAGLLRHPGILGGGRSVMVAELIYLRIFQSPDWGLGAAISVILMVGVGGLLALLMRQMKPGAGR
jgi:putative spermidine/putrescine transport system permease protein